MLHNLMPLPGWVIFLSIFFPLTTSAFQIIYGKECDEFTSQVEVQGWYDDARTLSKTAAAAWIINAVDADPLVNKLWGSLSMTQYELVGQVINAAKEMDQSESSKYEIYFNCVPKKDPPPEWVARCAGTNGGIMNTDSAQSIPNVLVCPLFWSLRDEGQLYQKSLPVYGGDRSMCQLAPRFIGQYYPGRVIYHEILHNQIKLRNLMVSKSKNLYDSTDYGYDVGTHGTPTAHPNLLQLASGYQSLNNPDTYSWFALLMFQRQFCGWGGDGLQPLSPLVFADATIPYGGRGDNGEIWPKMAVTTCPAGSTPTIELTPTTDESSWESVLVCWVNAASGVCPTGWKRENFKALGSPDNSVAETFACFVDITAWTGVEQPVMEQQVIAKDL